MTAIKLAAAAFASDAGVDNAALDSMKNTVDEIITNINDMDGLMKNFLSLFSTPKSYGNVGLQGFYGFLILFSVFALIGVLLTVCCNKYGCRHLMYFSCLFLFVVGLLGFFISFILSIIIPPATWGCSWFDVAVTNAAGFQGIHAVI